MGLEEDASLNEEARIVWSPEHMVTTPQPDFIVTTSQQNIQIMAGDTPTSILVNAELDSALPYAIVFAIDYERLADGLDVTFEREVVAASVVSDQITANVTASETMTGGHYMIPIVARSGLREHLLTIPVEVVTIQGQEGGTHLFLPVITQ
ncbi:MAG: hypothetical protein AAF702_40910 [Chloroflexota bacterium]